MKILFYIPDLNQGWGGVRQYSIMLLRMLQDDTENHYYVYHDLNDKEVIEAINDIQNHTLITSLIIKNPKTITVKVPDKRFSKIPGLRRLKVDKQIIIEDNLAGYCKKHEIQIIHCPYQFIPKISNVKLITTLHDVQEIHFPEFFSAESRAYRATSYLDFLRRANAVIVSYDHIKQDLIKYFDVPKERIRTILLQMDKLWFHQYSDKDLVKLPLNLNLKKFILYPAVPFKHKNHLRLLEAIRLLRDEGLNVDIVLTGDFNYENGINIVETCEKLNLKNQVTILGVVNEATLYTLYKKAVGVIIPTLYEAGSFPLMESMFLSVPVICSNVTSLPETIGNDDFVFDSTNIHSIASLLKKIYSDEEFRKRSVCNSEIQKGKFKNSNALNLIQETYSLILNEN